MHQNLQQQIVNNFYYYNLWGERLSGDNVKPLKNELKDLEFATNQITKRISSSSLQFPIQISFSMSGEEFFV